MPYRNSQYAGEDKKWFKCSSLKSLLPLKFLFNF